MFRRFLPVLPLTLLTLGPAAMAGDDRPEPWRLISQDIAATTSQCIGRPETPLCAVETLLACFQRANQALCRMVDDDEDQYAEVFSDPPESGKYLAYRIVGPRPPTERGLDAKLLVEQQEVATGKPVGSAPVQTSLFKLRRQADGSWKVTGWGDPSDME
ncbi:hypothetical protein [Telmatospirillum sp.]|uniref:hypothetical protein n=1 Tax=Telmatospirillum sp. TaxID=2079197 RepID=UPI0028436F30|nr:hypothetical protein [Telmatospirillum sp.]MDR3437212.1 hypothetical protein [Telmatospirillum sp.]